jgi:hypothetical protein
VTVTYLKKRFIAVLLAACVAVSLAVQEMPGTSALTAREVTDRSVSTTLPFGEFEVIVK